jgi:enterobactin synthetase component D
MQAPAEGSSLQALLETAIDDAELALLRQIEPALALAALATLVFSAKESFFKAAHAEVGRYFDFTAVKVTAVDAGRGCVTLEVREPLSRKLVPGVVRRADFGFLAEKTLFTSCLW